MNTSVRHFNLSDRPKKKQLENLEATLFNTDQNGCRKNKTPLGILDINMM